MILIYLNFCRFVFELKFPPLRLQSYSIAVCTYQGLMYLGQVAAVIMGREYYQRPASAHHRSWRPHRTAMSWAAAKKWEKEITNLIFRISTQVGDI